METDIRKVMEMLDEHDETIALFAEWAGRDLNTWRSLLGCTVLHSSKDRGAGTVLQVEPGTTWRYVWLTCRYLNGEKVWMTHAEFVATHAHVDWPSGLIETVGREMLIPITDGKPNPAEYRRRAKLFTDWAGEDVHRWQTLVGCRVRWANRASGVVADVTRQRKSQEVQVRCDRSGLNPRSFTAADLYRWYVRVDFTAEVLAKTHDGTSTPADDEPARDGSAMTHASRPGTELPGSSRPRDSELQAVCVATSEGLSQAAVRIGQEAFARNVRDNYGHQCCFPGCAVSDDRFLRGAHIARWVDAPHLRGETSNGLCLCLIHDTAFELGLFTLSPDLTVRVNSALVGQQAPAVDLVSGEGLSIRPGRIQPSRDALAQHWERIGFHP